MSAPDPGDPAALPGGAAGADALAAQRAASSRPASSGPAFAQPPPGPAPGPASPTSDAGASVNADSPWLGLASFTEATRGYFYGREQEITELERRVQRKLLTVLFGKSGLGKTSILQAGLVPGLRARGYFPVYLRIDYGHDSPEPAEQIKQAINRAAAVRAGERGERGERGESAGAAGEEAAARGATAEGIAAEEGAAQGAGQGPAAEGAAQGSNGQVAVGQGAVGQGRLGHGAAAPAIDPEESIWEFLHHREGAQSSEAVPQASGAVLQDVSAETRTVKSAATQTATTGSAAPAAPLGATASTVPLGATAPPIATAPLRATAPPTSTPAITAIPLLIFDQFEELFTLAQSDEFGRARAARFVEELADLVENRPPKALEAKLDSDDSLSERFDFARSDYRVVISLREDYLAPLESLKKQMPSLSQNRLRLAPMTGAQALEAVLLPGQRLAEDSVLPGPRLGAGAAQVSGRPLEAGGQLGAGAAGPPGAGTPLEPEMAQVTGRPLRAGKPLVSQEVAEAIVRFVAGGAELANAEVEPSLLSLICRELNEQRLAQHHSEISLGLLAGSRESILGSFYERSLADQPPAVRSLIEDELLTESGYRENLAEESLLRKLQTAGAAPDALAKLVNRRLLRIEERLDVRRVELTHDVLTGVVKASRDQRHEREARAATERLLAEQAARESAARRALRRARAIAAGCTALAVAAVVAALFAVINVQRARHAEADARQTRAVSEQARQEAEGLLGFLTDDFVRELETFGRYQTIAELSQREIDYFEALPPQLDDPQTTRSGALALVNHAFALIALGDTATAGKNAARAIALLEELQRHGDGSAATGTALGRAYNERGLVLATQNDPQASADFTRAVAMLRPIAGRPGASAEARRAYIEALSFSAWWAGNSDQYPEALRAAREAMRLATQLGAPRGDDVTVNADYAFAGGYLVGALVVLGHEEEARRAGADVLDAARQVLLQHPQDIWALAGKGNADNALAQMAVNELDPAEATKFATQAAQTGLAMVGIEPRNLVYIEFLFYGDRLVSSSTWSAGQLRAAIAYDHKAMEALGRADAVTLRWAIEVDVSRYAAVSDQAQLGDWAGAAQSVAAGDALMDKLRNLPGGGFTAAFINAMRNDPAATVAYERGDFGTARRIARAALENVQAFRPTGAFDTSLMNVARCSLSNVEGRADYQLGDFGAAAQVERTILTACKAQAGNGVAGQREIAVTTTWLSMALARGGRRDEAAQIIAPVVTMYRTLDRKNRSDRWLPLELAEALYAQSLTDDAHRAALLREAAQRIEHLVPAIAALHDTRAWRARIAAAQRSASGEARR